MEGGRYRGPGSRSACAFRQPYGFSDRPTRPQAPPEAGFRASHRAGTPRTRHQRREIRGPLDGCGSCRYLVGTVGDIFTMNWTEREGPPIPAPERRGFGTIVMDAMAARSVDGTVDLDYPPSGVTWRLTCPAGNALEPRGT